MGLLTGVTDWLGLTDSEAADRAIAAQTAAAQDAIKFQREIYGESKERFDPYTEGGLQSFQDLMAMGQDPEAFQMGDIQKDPGYQFRMEQGVQALDRSAASRGRLGSGATMKAIQSYGQDLASQEYGQAYGRNRQQITDRQNLLNQLSQYGQTANLALSGQAQNMAQNIGQTTTQLGSARAAAEMGRGNDMKDLWKMGVQAYAMS